MKNITSTLSIGFACFFALTPIGSVAADQDYTVPNTSDTVIYWGFDYVGAASKGYGVDAGFVTALNGDIGATGWTLTGNLGGSRSSNALASSNSISSSVLLGYQWHAPEYYFSLGAGAHYVNNNETPPGGPNDRSQFGAIVQYGFETKATNSFYAQSYGAASSAFDQLYFHAKAGMKTDTLRFGAEFTASDESNSFGVLRYGAFVGDIPLGDKLSMVLSAGYQDDLDPTVRDGFYASIGFVIPLDLR